MEDSSSPIINQVQSFEYTVDIKSDESKEEKEEQIKNLINYNDVNSLFSNLSSLNIFELNDLRKKYENINYSSTDVNSAIQKF